MRLVTNSNVNADIIRVREFLLEEGEKAWVDRQHCVMTASYILNATVGNKATEAEFVSALGFATYKEAYRWNDAPERTFQEVIDRLNDALV